MTAEDKAKKFLDEHMAYYTDDLTYHLAKLLKRQDRDTRHACAEAVMNIDDIDKTKAHNACMNTRAV